MPFPLLIACSDFTSEELTPHLEEKEYNFVGRLYPFLKSR